MKCLKELGDVFGSTTSEALMYNPMPREELATKLKGLELWGELDEPPHLFFKEMLDKLYGELGEQLAPYLAHSPPRPFIHSTLPGDFHLARSLPRYLAYPACIHARHCGYTWWPRLSICPSVYPWPNASMVHPPQAVRRVHTT